LLGAALTVFIFRETVTLAESVAYVAQEASLAKRAFTGLQKSYDRFRSPRYRPPNGVLGWLKYSFVEYQLDLGAAHGQGYSCFTTEFDKFLSLVEIELAGRTEAFKLLEAKARFGHDGFSEMQRFCAKNHALTTLYNSAVHLHNSVTANNVKWLGYVNHPFDSDAHFEILARVSASWGELRSGKSCCAGEIRQVIPRYSQTVTQVLPQ
jgi:hypothetical protein